MFAFFDTALGWLQVIGEFVVATIESSVKACVIILSTLIIPYTIAGLLPGILGAGCLITLSILIIRFLVGVIS